MYPVHKPRHGPWYQDTHATLKNSTSRHGGNKQRKLNFEIWRFLKKWLARFLRMYNIFSKWKMSWCLCFETDEGLTLWVNEYFILKVMELWMDCCIWAVSGLVFPPLNFLNELFCVVKVSWRIPPCKREWTLPEVCREVSLQQNCHIWKVIERVVSWASDAGE